MPNRSRSSLSATSLIFDLNNVKSRLKMVASWRKSSTVAGQKQVPDSTRTLARPLRVWLPRLRRARKLVSLRRARTVLSCKRLPLSNHYHGHLWKSAIPYFIGLRLEQALSSVWRGKEGRGSDIGLGWRLGNIHIIGVQACRFFAFAFSGVIHRRSCSGTGSWISRGSKVLYNGSRRNYNSSRRCSTREIIWST